MTKKLVKFINQEASNLQAAGLYKYEFLAENTRYSQMKLADDREVINFCSDNYLGLGGNKDVRAAAQKAIEEEGFGTGDSRIICGTSDRHKGLESWISTYLDTNDTIIFQSAYEASIGLFESFVGDEDAIFCESFCSAAIKDGVRLSRAESSFYRGNDVVDLENYLKRSKNARFRVIVTEGVFSVDGTISRLTDICELAKTYDALVVLDDSHGFGVLGEKGRGTHEFFSITDEVDLTIGTFTHILGGPGGGFISGNESLIAWLRQKSKPYLFSSTLSPSMVAASTQALQILIDDNSSLVKLRENTQLLYKGLSDRNYQVQGSEHPILSIMIGDVVMTQKMVNGLLDLGVYVMGFCYPLVPKGMARLRLQVSSDHSQAGIKRTLEAFDQVME